MSAAIVTGGAGFVGSHVAELLQGEGYDVVVIDDLSSGSLENVPSGCSLLELDITDRGAVDGAIRTTRPAFVCHLAAQSSVTVSVREPARDLAVNVLGTMHVCDAAAAVGAPVAFASTGGALYGDRAPIPSPEDTPPEPLAPYGASKLAAEAYVATWGRLNGQPNTILRLGNVYGPRQSPHGEAGVVAIFSERLLRGAPVTVYGDGRQTRDYVHVADVARAFLLAGRSASGGTFNVGTGAETTVLELLDLLQRAAATTVPVEFEPLRRGELLASALDGSRIRHVLGWEPQTDLASGLEATLASYGDAASPAPTA